MVITLVLIIVAGGFYMFSMGGMNHSKVGNNATSTPSQNQGQVNQKQDTANQQATGNEHQVAANQQEPSQEQQKASANQQQPSQDQQKDTNTQQNNQPGVPLGPPVIIQAPPPVQKTDTRLYLEQLKEKIKSINEANATIASNAGGQSMVVQSNGSVTSSGQANMNQLHEGFYKLGQSVSSMEQTVDNMSRDINEANSGSQYYQVPPTAQYPGQLQQPYYYGYPQSVQPNYYQYNPSNPNMPNQGYQAPNPQSQTQPNQPGQNQMGQQPTQQTQSGG